MKNDNFKLLMSFADGQMNRPTDICDCRVAFVTDKIKVRSDIRGFLILDRQ